jgi:hypothetical protein
MMEKKEVERILKYRFDNRNTAYVGYKTKVIAVIRGAAGTFTKIIQKVGVPRHLTWKVRHLGTTENTHPGHCGKYCGKY